MTDDQPTATGSTLRPDFDRTMTGYRWLDWTLAPILNPYNAIVGWVYERKLDHLCGIYGTTKERRAQRSRIFASIPNDPERPVLWGRGVPIMTDRTTATGSTLLDRLTFPYWYLLEQWSLLRLDRVLGIRGVWWGRQAKRREFWDEFARAGGFE